MPEAVNGTVDDPDWTRLIEIECAERMRKMKARLKAVEFVCAERERELLELKGPCSNYFGCGLHFAHAGPCDGQGKP